MSIYKPFNFRALLKVWLRVFFDLPLPLTFCLSSVWPTFEYGASKMLLHSCLSLNPFKTRLSFSLQWELSRLSLYWPGSWFYLVFMTTHPTEHSHFYSTNLCFFLSLYRLAFNIIQHCKAYYYAAKNFSRIRWNFIITKQITPEAFLDFILPRSTFFCLLSFYIMNSRYFKCMICGTYVHQVLPHTLFYSYLDKSHVFLRLISIFLTIYLSLFMTF